MKDYFQILGLQQSADIHEVKQAYRDLAKRYHPDVNKAPDAQVKFILVNEAYEFLRDDERRSSYVMNKQRAQSVADQRRRDALYDEWVRRQQAAARRRAEQHAHQSFDKFMQSPIYKTAMVFDKIYNYIFLGIGLMLIFIPSVWYFGLSEIERLKMHVSIWSVIIPGLFGLAFTYGIYYFLFRKND